MAVTSTALYNKEEFTNRLGKRTQHKILYAVGYLCKICKRLKTNYAGKKQKCRNVTKW